MGLFEKHKKIKGGKALTEAEWPQDGDVYFWVRSDIGQICQSEWNEGVPHHSFRKATGNCFRTRADASEGISMCMRRFGNE